MLFHGNNFHFLRNREIDVLYFTIALLLFGEGLISIFVPIYFWQLGFPLWKIVYFYFLISLSFLILSFLIIPFLKKLSDKSMMFFSLPFVALYFIGLGYLQDYPALFYFLPPVLAINMILFNVGYHLSFSGAADGEYIGRELGMRHFVSDIVTFSAPFLGGLLIAFFGFRQVFLIASFFLLLAILPLFFFPRRRISPAVSARKIIDLLKDKNLMPFTISGIGYANERMVALIVWPLFLFFKIGDIRELGGVISLGLFASAIVTFSAGFLADHGKRRRLLKYSTWLFSGVWFLRPFVNTVAVATWSNIAGHVASSSLLVAWESQYYKIARAMGAGPQAGGLSTFILSREVLYHISRVLFLPVLMALGYLLPQNQFFFSGFIMAALFALLLLFSNRAHNLY
ncbi:hypothetical protein A2926_03185 [Candidatus Giovannonibacteria bacterium RIFCSPLOWO2_01_FULL_44_40]|uniref:Major facilitator superfamily (MFS) profile domain-containing protein n=1 Tax=Candidatus Giovannonibacteria bacterium RIFCSPHIGHO2_01_FULL_45_23 TaxID=1798325 RepID=A0A1F5VF47_9BACT|nr:MAG: hypothetical protein A2834_01915 [Candidatus Giovannonibacteria bacterium RIFCSPHIGHO2_01_FULL_45_23]OGF75060.1 MAG: hypothetical protein A3C77_04020 [Candidatus Giovannonibacteria bacterium RIFCSPHIGHO2_02_FULL_45_13]OGF80167.1 MAG: hypothetical protein A2926_03185 [Candidatus Giovannonibacteria bacterium RIFCSPLOWO2_01_FULL_44_40]